MLGAGHQAAGAVGRVRYSYFFEGGVFLAVLLLGGWLGGWRVGLFFSLKWGGGGPEAYISVV